MEEVGDFEGFTPEHCVASLKFKSCLEQILKAKLSNTSRRTKIKRKKRRGRPKKSSVSLQPSKGQAKRKTLLNYWELREQYTSGAPHTVLDHAHWFEKVIEGFGDRNKSTDLNYQQYIKLTSLESSVNATMFISVSNEFTSQQLWEQLVHRTTSKVTKGWMETTLNQSPLFYLVTHRNVWERTGLKCQGGKKYISIGISHLLYIICISQSF